MTLKRMIELLAIEHECSQANCDRDCAKCSLVQSAADLDEMYTAVITLMSTISTTMEAKTND